jgi:hydrogenase maturation protein HypF
MIETGCNESYSFNFDKNLSFQSTIRDIVNDIQAGVTVSLISAKFHNTIIKAIVDVADQMYNIYKVNKVVISGGVFQNRYLLENLEKIFEKKKTLKLYTPEKIPCNDGGIALGQLVIAAKKYNKHA